MKKCEHGVVIPETSRATKRAPDCLACHEQYLMEAAQRSAEYRRELSVEEKDAWLQYQRDYSREHRHRKNAQRRLWRAERRLFAAFEKGDEAEIQKRRLQLALASELIHVFGAW